MAAALIAATCAFEIAVVAGESMAPTLRAGDVVIAASWMQPDAGDIVLFTDAGALVVHRVDSVQPDGELITRGDANPVADFEPVAPDSALGVVVLVLPMAGWV